jgi:F-type H+-transporting ATPase subunit epsilon
MPPDQLNASDLEDRLRRAEEAAERAEDGSEEQRRAQRDRKRWQAFLRIARA